jgi:hypothetical protein
MADDSGFSSAEVGETVKECPLKKKPPELHWISIALQDEEGVPAAWEEYQIKLSNGDVIQGFLGEDGKAKVSSIEDFANCEVTFPAVDKSAWGD